MIFYYANASDFWSRSTRRYLHLQSSFDKSTMRLLLRPCLLDKHSSEYLPSIALRNCFHKSHSSPELLVWRDSLIQPLLQSGSKFVIALMTVSHNDICPRQLRRTFFTVNANDSNIRDSSMTK